MWPAGLGPIPAQSRVTCTEYGGTLSGTDEIRPNQLFTWAPPTVPRYVRLGAEPLSPECAIQRPSRAAGSPHMTKCQSTGRQKPLENALHRYRFDCLSAASCIVTQRQGAWFFYSPSRKRLCADDRRPKTLLTSSRRHARRIPRA